MSWKESWLDWIYGENMDVSKLKSDKLIEMTEEMDRSFVAAGCNPTCHCCNDEIPVGAYYKLSTVTHEHIERCRNSILYTYEGVFKTAFQHEVMLCSKDGCTPDEMITKAVQNKRDRAPVSYRSGGCSIINGKIVP